MSGSITKSDYSIRINKDPICAATSIYTLPLKPGQKILGGSGSVQPYNKLCGYNNYLPMLLGADYLNTGGCYMNTGFPIINYCVPKTIGFLDQGNQTLFTLGECNTDISSLFGGNNNTNYSLCGTNLLSGLSCGNMFGGNILGSLLGGGLLGGLFSGGLFGNMFGNLGGIFKNLLTNMFGPSGSVNGNGTSTSWGPNGMAMASGNGAYLFSNANKSNNINLGLLGNYAKDSNGNKAWSVLNGLVSSSKFNGNKSTDYSNLVNIGLASLFDALC